MGVGKQVEIEEDMAARTSASTVVVCFVEMRWCSICIVEFCKRGRWVKAVVSKASRRRRKRTMGRNNCKKNNLFTYTIARELEGAREARGKRDTSQPQPHSSPMYAHQKCKLWKTSQEF